jgi:predicted dehydrogenase/threonine dehydrogenase-like Zn-dependent dehydrogenase
MRQVFTTKRGEVVVADVPAPMCGRGELVVATHWSVISAGTETASTHPSPSARRAVRRSLARRAVEVLRADGLSPVVDRLRDRGNLHAELGYSAAGVVVEVGRDVAGFRVGERVACAGGGFACHAEVIRVPPMLCARVPSAVPLRSAAWTTLGAIALQGVRRAQPELGSVALVTGLGTLGLLTVQLLKASGCAVVAADLDPRRVAVALALGADRAVDSGEAGAVEAAVAELSGGIGADCALLTAKTSSSGPVAQAMDVVRQRGRVVVVGDVGLDVPRAEFYRKEIELTMSCSYGPGRYDDSYELDGRDYPPGFVRWTEQRNLSAFLGALASGAVDPERLVTDVFPIEEAPAAYERLAGGGGALGVMLEYPAAAREATPALNRSVSVRRGPSNGGRVGVAVIGAGSFAREVFLPAAAAHPGLALVAVASRTGKAAVAAARRFGAERASTEWRELLCDPLVEAVFVATRHDSHAEIAAAVLAAGKHVLVEKPLALDEGGIASVLAAQEASGAVLLVGHNRRFSPAALAIREALAARGGPAMIVCRVNAGHIPASHWTQDPAVGGGRIVGEVCHFLDLASALLCDPESVTFDARAVPPGPGGPDTFDNVSIQLAFSDGSTAQIAYTAMGGPGLGKERVEAHGGGRSFVIDDFRELRSFGPGALPAWSSARPDKGHTAEVAAFAAAIRGRGDAVPPPWVQARAARLALSIDAAVRQAARTERP